MDNHYLTLIDKDSYWNINIHRTINCGKKGKIDNFKTIMIQAMRADAIKVCFMTCGLSGVKITAHKTLFYDACQLIRIWTEFHNMYCIVTE